MALWPHSQIYAYRKTATICIFAAEKTEIRSLIAQTAKAPEHWRNHSYCRTRNTLNGTLYANKPKADQARIS